MAASPNASQVRVGVRIRPLSSKEKSEGGGGKVVVESNAFDRTVALSKRKFTYDSVFHPNVTQSDLYANVAPPLLSAFCNGYNSTVIAYGQTGAGKTYTMGSEAGGNFEGNLRNASLGDNEGLIPRFMSDMFASLVERREASEKALLQSRKGNNISEQTISLIDFNVTASFLEVYGEDIFDLLDEDRNALKIREDTNKEVIVVGLQSSPCANAADAMNVLNTGTMNRTTASTLMNFTSSRSHAVFTVNLQQMTRSDDGDELTTKSRFSFVDLAGSERMKKTGAEGERAKEGIKINEGLLALGNVINALADEDRLAKGEKVHVPYRQSKLTRLLQDGLGGNSQTLFLACVSPSDTNASETLSTLHYANRARNIKNAPTRNVDATAEELRRLRTLTNLLKCELIKQRFDGAVDPEVERANESAIDTQDIGVVNEDLLQRDDVIAYVKQIDEKATALTGSMSNPIVSFPTPSSTFSPDRPMPQTIRGTPTKSQQFLRPIENSSYDEDDDSHSDMNMSVHPDEDIQVIDDLLLENLERDSGEISKIEGDIEEQEDRLLQIKENLLVYHDIKEKFESLSDEVQKLESEKQALAEKLEKAEKGGGCSLSIKTKLEQVKASLARARQDVRKQQQKCREAEQDAQRCKGLERRIEEMKSTRVNMIRKQRDDAKKQKDVSKTKAREIQDARRREKTAQKKVLKLEAENARYKTNLERSKTRHDKLSNKLKQTESNLKKALARKRNNSSIVTRGDVGTDVDGMGQFAPSNGKINSIKYVLDKTVSDRVKLSQNRLVYMSKAEQRENLVRCMAMEVKLLNELKRKCESTDSEPSSEVLAEVNDREDNVQDFLIQIELVENSLEELQAKYPSIEDVNSEEESGGNIFDENEPALKMISKMNGPVLRTLMLDLLGSYYTSELDRQCMNDALARKDCTLSMLEDDVASQNDTNCILTQSLGRHEEKIKMLEIKHHTEVLRITKDLKEAHAADLERANCSHSEELVLLRSKIEASATKAIAQTTEELSASYALQLENLRNELQSSASLELQSAQDAAGEQHAAEVERITNNFKKEHAGEVEKVKEDMVAMTNSSKSEALEKLRSEMEALASKAAEQTSAELSASHALELETLKNELQLSASLELQRAQAAAEEQHAAEVQRITKELEEIHAKVVVKVKEDMAAMANSSTSEALEKLRSEMEASSSKAMEQTSEKLSASHALELENLRTELQLSASLELQSAQAAAEEQHLAEVQRITKELEHATEVFKVKEDAMAMTNSSKSEELEKLRLEIEISATKAMEQTSGELFASHALELVNLRTELQSSASQELQRAQAAAEEQHQAEVQRITKELEERHASELEKVKGNVLSMTPSEMEALATKSAGQTSEEISASHALELENLSTELQSSASQDLQRAQAAAEEQHAAEVQRITKEMECMKLDMTTLKNTHEGDLAHVRSRREDSSSQLLATQNQLELLKEKLACFVTDQDSLLRELTVKKQALTILEEKFQKSEEKIAELLSHQKQVESVEDQINSCVSSKDTLLTELEKTSLLKELEKTKEALALSDKKHTRSERQLATLPFVKGQLESITEQLKSHVSEKDQLRKELEDTKKELAQVKSIHGGEGTEMKIDEAFSDNRQKSTPQAPYEKKSPRRSPRDASLVIDTSNIETRASSELVGSPSSVHSSSSAVFPSFSKFDSLKQRYRKKVREHQKPAEDR